MSKQLTLLAEDAAPQVLELTAEASLEWSEIEAQEGGVKIPTFTMLAYTGRPMRVAGFGQPVVVDLAGSRTESEHTPIFRGHDADKIVGHGSVVISGEDIRTTGVVSADNEHSREVVTSSKNGFPWQASIGASVELMEQVKAGEKVTVNGKTWRGPLLVARKTVINEVSVVPLGADRRTSTKVAASSAGTTPKEIDMDFAAWLKANEFDVATLSDKQQTKLKAQYDAENAPPKEEPKPSPHGAGFLATLEAERKEKDRVDAIDALAKAAIRTDPTQLDTIEKMTVAAHADKSIDARQFELELLRAMRPPGPSNIRRGDTEIGARVLEAAVCRSLGLKEVEKQYDARTLEACDKHFRHGIGLQQLLFKSAAANGQHYDSAANVRGLLQAAFGASQIQAGGFSAISLPGVLSNIMNKLLLDHFNAVDQTWRSICARIPVRDFKQISSYALSGDAQYEKLPPTGEIKHGTMGETTYTNQADTYAKMLAITRVDIINDDLGAFQRVPQRLGRGGGLKINDVFWTIFLNNSSFFTSGNNNVSTGGGSALGTAEGAAINAAEVKFMNQTDPDGKPLGVMPKIMVVPPTLRNTAARWMGSQLFIGSSGLGDSNIFGGRYSIASSPYMENTSYTGNSTAAWYLLADPADMPVIQGVFLNGKDTPTVESADADFDQLGIQVRAYHDFGFALQEYRGGVRSAGS